MIFDLFIKKKDLSPYFNVKFFLNWLRQVNGM